MLIRYDSHLKNFSLGQDDFTIRKPITVTINEFDEKSTKEFFTSCEEALETGQNLIPVIIDSYGGEVYSLLAMIDYIKQSKIPIMTICSGKACSCGSILLSCGHPGYRYANPHSSIMIHDLSSVIYGKYNDMEIDLKESKRLNSLIFKILDENCKQKSGFFAHKLDKINKADLWLTADKAKEYRLIDQVGSPDLTYKISAEFKISK